MKQTQKNVTFSLPPQTIDQVRELASRYDCSMNTIVKDALEAWIQVEEQAALEQAMRDASADPLFQEDMAAVHDDFAQLDSELLPVQTAPDEPRNSHEGKGARKRDPSKRHDASRKELS